VKKSAKAGETACATFASPLFAVVGQALSPANAACGRFFLTTAETLRRTQRTAVVHWTGVNDDKLMT
jgi:hypothetical protein